MGRAEPLWQRSLVTVLDLLTADPDGPGLEGRWMVVGSAATAIHGVDIEPGDIDILVRQPDDVRDVAGRLASYAAETSPSLDPEHFLSTQRAPTTATDDGVWTFGRWWINGTKVECAHIALDPGSGVLIESCGDEVWRHRRLIEWNGRNAPVVALEIQAATSLSRQLNDRARAILTFLQIHDEDSQLLMAALSSRGCALGPGIP
jgi:hypothetical protein